MNKLNLLHVLFPFDLIPCIGFLQRILQLFLLFSFKTRNPLNSIDAFLFFEYLKTKIHITFLNHPSVKKTYKRSIQDIY